MPIKMCTSEKYTDEGGDLKTKTRKTTHTKKQPKKKHKENEIITQSMSTKSNKELRA